MQATDESLVKNEVICADTIHWELSVHSAREDLVWNFRTKFLVRKFFTKSAYTKRPLKQRQFSWL